MSSQFDAVGNTSRSVDRGTILILVAGCHHDEAIGLEFTYICAYCISIDLVMSQSTTTYLATMPLKVDSVARNGDGILDGLSTNTNSYRYPGRKQFWDIIQGENDLFQADETGRSEFIVFSHLDERTFLQDIDSREFAWFDSYSPSEEILIVKITTGAHELAHTGFALKMHEKLIQMNAHKSVYFKAKQTRGTRSRRKEPDQQFQPKILPPGRSKQWPSMIIEAGYSESKSKLAADARWWLQESAGDVKVALTISIHKSKREIVYEIWELVDGHQTRAEPERRVPQSRQQVVVSQSQAAASVANAPLVIPFECLFLREAGAQEDLILTNDDLIELAEYVWQGDDYPQ